MGILNEKIEGTNISVDIISSNLKHAKYETDTKKLFITFKNDTEYVYEDVPWNIYTKFTMSESQGSFFSKNISKVYKYNKIK